MQFSICRVSNLNSQQTCSLFAAAADVVIWFDFADYLVIELFFNFFFWAQINAKRNLFLIQMK